ncbi:MAG: hypothetical protein JWM21_3940 [Acidobacteria bacterium]|nr:hypothetical protein [Acidobacteriota bacterium]
MRSPQKWIVLLLLIVAIALSAIAALRSQAQNATEKQRIDKTLWPLVDHSSPEPSDAQARLNRSAKSKNHDKSDWRVDPTDPADTTTRVDGVDLTLPDMPLAQSKTVVIGDVLNAQAYLSNDKTGVYSEFTIKVDEIITNRDVLSISPGCVIEADRQGGRVRFASGRIHWYSIAKENMPGVGARYVFFLTRDDALEDFHIVTAYELKAGKVYALDELSQFGKHDGEEEAAFLMRLRKLAVTSLQRTQQ